MTEETRRIHSGSMSMLAYHSNQTVKDNILAQLSRHRAAGEIVQGIDWENGKGGAVGGTIESDNHVDYEARFGIPQILAYMKNQIFDELPNAQAKDWPVRFMGAIRVGADLTMIWPLFALWLLEEELPQHTLKYPQATAALAYIVALYRECLTARKNPEPARLGAVLSRARAVADNADDAAESAIYAAIYAAETLMVDASWAANYVAEIGVGGVYAADEACHAAADAVYAAEVANYSAAEIADYAFAEVVYASARRARHEARQQAYIRQADKLIALLEVA